MNNQQKYHSQIHTILQHQNQISLLSLLHRLIDPDSSPEELSQDLKQLSAVKTIFQQVNKNHPQEKDGPEMQINEIKALDVPIERIVDVLSEFFEMERKVTDQLQQKKNDFEAGQQEQSHSQEQQHYQMEQQAQQQQNILKQHPYPVQPITFEPFHQDQQTNKGHEAEEDRQFLYKNLKTYPQQANQTHRQYQQKEIKQLNKQNKQQEKRQNQQQQKQEAQNEFQNDNYQDNQFDGFDPEKEQQEHHNHNQQNLHQEQDQIEKRRPQDKSATLDDNKGNIAKESPIKRTRSWMFKKYNNLKQKITPFLIVSYYQYVLQLNSNNNEIFDKNQIFKKPLMDLTLFLKFYKDFNLKILLNVHQIIKIFKKQAYNHLWIDATKMIDICFHVVEMKAIDNSQTVVKVAQQQELMERADRFLKLFDKDKTKKYLQVSTKQLWNQILNQYQQRNVVNLRVGKTHQNKEEVVGKFIERNFINEVPKWYGRKELNLQKNLKSRPNAVSKISGSSDRDEKSISQNIKKLKSQSEKNLNFLKSMIGDNFDKNIKSLIQKKQNHMKNPKAKNQTGTRKTPIQKAKTKNTISVYKEIEKYVNNNVLSMKSQKGLLAKQLKLGDDEPFLSAYFNYEFKNKTNNKINEMIDAKKANYEKPISQRKNLEKNDQRKLPNIKEVEALKRNNQKQIFSPILKKNSKNILANQFERLQDIRKHNSRSEPSYPSLDKAIKKRVYSMKKLENQKQKYKHLILLGSEHNSNNSSKLGDKKLFYGKNIKLNEEQNKLLNKKLYDFLINNNQHQNGNLLNLSKSNNKMSKSQKQNSSVKKSKKQVLNTEISKYDINQFHLQSSKPVPQNKLIQEFKHEMSQLWKNFSHKDRQDNEIITNQTEKRKGYLKHEVGRKKQKNPKENSITIKR